VILFLSLGNFYLKICAVFSA